VCTVYSRVLVRVVYTWPFSSWPLYTLPKPPSPKRQSERKFFVAVASSRNVNDFAVLSAEELPLGSSLLGALSDDGLFFGESVGGCLDSAKVSYSILDMY
jgi:hypothetical protein